jgi:uncharacterized protein
MILTVKKYFLNFFFLFVFFFAKSQNTDSIVTINRVTDNAAIFSESARENLENTLIDFEKKTTNQIAVVTINSLDGNTIENSALKIFNNNGLGQKDKDNGVLLLFAKNDRKVRIEVGYGLEHVLTDALSSRIIRQIMIPEFKKENYATGIEKGVNAILHITGKELGYETLSDTDAEELYSDNENLSMPIWLKIIITLFLSIFIGVGVFVTRANPLLKFSTYTNLFSGKTSVLQQLINSIQGVFLLPFTLGFLLMPFGFLFFIWEIDTIVDYQENYDYIIKEIEGINTNSKLYKLLLKILGPVFVFFTIIQALWVKLVQHEPIKLQWALTKAEKKAFKSSSSGRSYSSSGSSFSSSSSSSFGGGGSSAGGGSSGSW